MSLFIKLVCLFSFAVLFSHSAFALEVQPFKLKKIKSNQTTKEPFESSRIQNNRDDINTDNSKPNFWIGLKGGIQLSNGESNNINDISPLTRFPIGFTFDYQLNPYISVGLYLHYVEKGVETGGDNVVISFTYLGFNPDIKIFPVKKWFYIAFGPSIYYHLSSKVDPDVVQVGTNFGSDLVLGVHAGLGVFFEVDPFRISLEGRYDHGLTNMFNQSKMPASISDAELTYRDFQLYLGISYNL